MISFQLITRQVSLLLSRLSLPPLNLHLSLSLSLFLFPPLYITHARHFLSSSSKVTHTSYFFLPVSLYCLLLFLYMTHSCIIPPPPFSSFSSLIIHQFPLPPLFTFASLYLSCHTCTLLLLLRISLPLTAASSLYPLIYIATLAFYSSSHLTSTQLPHVTVKDVPQMHPS